MNLLLDTHVILWWAAGGDRLSVRARRDIARADRVLLSPISFWEIGLLVSRGRVTLDRDLLEWIADLMDEPEVELATLSPSAAASAAELAPPFPADPADRMIYSTAREWLVPIVTKDERIHAYATDHREVRVLW